MLDQPRIVRGADTVADPLGADLERLPHALRAGGLASVTREPQASIAGLRIQIAKPQRGTFRLKSAQTDRDHSIREVIGREVEHWRSGFGAELANSIEDPSNR